MNFAVANQSLRERKRVDSVRSAKTPGRSRPRHRRIERKPTLLRSQSFAGQAPRSDTPRSRTRDTGASAGSTDDCMRAGATRAGAVRMEEEGGTVNTLKKPLPPRRDAAGKISHQDSPILFHQAIHSPFRNGRPFILRFAPNAANCARNISRTRRFFQRNSVENVA